MTFLELIFRAVAMMALIIVLTRANGLRSFSKMSAFDFAVTVAVGSVLAGAVTTPGTPLVHFVAGIVGLFAYQAVVGRLRARLGAVQRLSDNPPRMVLWEGRILDDNLTRSGMTRADLMAKLREANALRIDDVHAVVVESTGDVSVLHGAAEGGVSERLLEGVRR